MRHTFVRRRLIKKPEPLPEMPYFSSTGPLKHKNLFKKCPRKLKLRRRKLKRMKLKRMKMRRRRETKPEVWKGLNMRVRYENTQETTIPAQPTSDQCLLYISIHNEGDYEYPLISWGVSATSFSYRVKFTIKPTKYWWRTMLWYALWPSDAARAIQGSTTLDTASGRAISIEFIWSEFRHTSIMLNEASNY